MVGGNFSLKWKTGRKTKAFSPTRLRGRNNREGGLRPLPKQERPTEKKKLFFLEREALTERERESPLLLIYIVINDAKEKLLEN
jgi:hypothetical protein